jgi:very-short-patch-repair endonuclease
VHRYRKGGREFARALRKSTTYTEAIVWRWLRDRRFGNWKFRRQYPIGPFIVDFYCDALRLAVEIDGESHDFTNDYDMRRTRYLAKWGIHVVRISNREVLRESDTAADVIVAAILERLPLTRRFAAPSPKGEG